MDLTFLGTASAYPTPSRGVSCIIYRNEGANWMFDCGEGSQIQLMKSTIRPGKISKIFITHLHGDHLFGLPGMLCTFSQNYITNSSESRRPLVIYGPTGLAKYLRVNLGLSHSELALDFIVHELKPLMDQHDQNFQDWPMDLEVSGELHPNERPGSTIEADHEGIWHLFEDDTHIVKASWLRHKMPCFGFAIQEKPRPGRLDPLKLRQKGILPGPLYSKIKSGESITSSTGEIIHPVDVLGPETPGCLVAILGDSSDSHHMAPLCQEADVLVHEATLANAMRDNAIEKGHSTPGMAGEFARTVMAKCLILTHFSQRYKSDKDETILDSVGMLVKEAKVAFGTDNVLAADDLETIVIKTNKNKRKRSIT